MLFVPGDSAKKIARSADSEADIIIFDLECRLSGPEMEYC